MFFSFWLISLCRHMDGPRDCQTNDLILFPFIAEKYSIVYMYHNFLIHSSVDRHLSCFHVLAIINSAAMHIPVHVSFWIMFFFGYMPRSGIASSILVFLKEPPCHSSYWLSQFTFPPTVQDGFIFSTPSSVYIVCGYFGSWPFWDELIPACSFDLHFSNN